MSFNERIGIFIDLNNVEKSLEEYNEAGLYLDYSDMVNEIAEDRCIVALRVYDGNLIGDNKNRGELHRILEDRGFELILKESHYSKERGEVIQKEVDTALVSDSVRMACMDELDTVVIVSGDLDMRPAVETVRMIGKKAEIASFPSVMSDNLSDSADRTIKLDDLHLLCFAGTCNEVLIRNLAGSMINIGGFADGE